MRVPLNMGMSAAHCQGNVRDFQSVWRVVTLHITTCDQRLKWDDMGWCGVAHEPSLGCHFFREIVTK